MFVNEKDKTRNFSRIIKTGKVEINATFRRDDVIIVSVEKKNHYIF